MSLEAKIEALTNAVTALTEAQTEHTERLNVVLAKGATGGGETEDKPARKPRAKKEDTKTEGEDDNTGSDENALTHDGVKAIAAAWLGEFAKNEKDPETQARKEKIKATLAAMAKKDGFAIKDEAKGATIADVPAAELHRVVAWMEKQKAADNGFGAGRLTEVPGSKAETSGDEDI